MGWINGYERCLCLVLRHKILVQPRMSVRPAPWQPSHTWDVPRRGVRLTDTTGAALCSPATGESDRTQAWVNMPTSWGPAPASAALSSVAASPTLEPPDRPGPGRGPRAAAWDHSHETGWGCCFAAVGLVAVLGSKSRIPSDGPASRQSRKLGLHHPS